MQMNNCAYTDQEQLGGGGVGTEVAFKVDVISYMENNGIMELEENVL